jgi:nucleotide-binding universal stress UspA family protein
MTGIIVVGVDDSETARKAAESARDLAAALNVSLHVVSAWVLQRVSMKVFSLA